jgi:hypothetical protein
MKGDYTMFSVNSKIFISCESITRNATVSETKQLFKKKKTPYVLSFHNGFKNFDYTQIENIEIQPVPSIAYRISVITPSDRIYTLDVDKYQRIYTEVRGYIPVYKINERDIIIDIAYNKCKLINMEKITPTEEYVSLSSKYNKSLCCNNILIKDN